MFLCLNCLVIGVVGLYVITSKENSVVCTGLPKCSVETNPEKIALSLDGTYCTGLEVITVLTKFQDTDVPISVCTATASELGIHGGYAYGPLLSTYTLDGDVTYYSSLPIITDGRYTADLDVNKGISTNMLSLFKDTDSPLYIPPASKFLVHLVRVKSEPYYGLLFIKTGSIKEVLNKRRKLL